MEHRKHGNTDDTDPPVVGQMVQIGTDKKIKKISDHPFNLCHLSARWRISVPFSEHNLSRSSWNQTVWFPPHSGMRVQ
jgi:hypothetical protein